MVGSDVSVLSCEREVELLEEGQLTALFVTFLRSFILVQNMFLFGWITLASFTPLNPPHPSRLTSEKTFSIPRNEVNSITTELAISRTPKRQVRQWALR